MDDFHIPAIIDWGSKQSSDYKFVDHTLIKVSGVDFNWGGGATPGTYLHCQPIGTADYTNTLLHASSGETGSSVVKARVSAFLISDITIYESEFSTWGSNLKAYEATLTGTEEEQDDLVQSWRISNPAPTEPSSSMADSNEITIIWN